MNKDNRSIIYDEKPWGLHAVLSDAGHYKVKELIVLPAHRTSYQLHHHRTEFWLVLEGTGILLLNDVEQILETGDTVWIGAEAAHRISNEANEPLVILETQFLEGDELSETDILRIEDDYGRDKEFLINEVA